MGDAVESHLGFLATILGVRTAYGLFNAAIGITVLPASLIADLLWQGAGAWTGVGASVPLLFDALIALLAGILFAILIK